MSAQSRWLRLNTDWHLSDWVVVLSAESRLAWIQLLCHVKVNGFAGKCKAIAPQVAERLWFVNEPSIRQMLQAAENSGALVIENGTWFLTGWSKFQGDETNAERQKRFKDKKKVTEVTVGNGGVTEVTTTETETETETKTKPIDKSIGSRKLKFSPPSEEEVVSYFKEKDSTKEEAIKFMLFYESKNWMVGKNKMSKWRSSAGLWMSRNKQKDSSDEWEVVC